MSDIKPCPFCGNTEAQYEEDFPAVVCRCCGAVGPTIDMAEPIDTWPKIAVRDWNERVTSTDPVSSPAASAELPAGSG